MNELRNALVTALVVVALLVSAIYLLDAFANPIDHNDLNTRLIRLERLMEESVCLLEAGPDRTPVEIAACRVDTG